MQMSEINQLPNRNIESFQRAKKIKLTTNLYEIRLDKLKATFFRYDFVTQEGEDSLDKLLAFKELKDQRGLYEKIGFVCESKEGLIGSLRVDDVIELNDKTKKTAPLSLKLTKSINIDELLGEQTRFHVLNHLIIPLTKRSQQTGDRSSKAGSIGQHKILISPKCTFSYVQIKKKLYLATNVKINIRQMCNLFSYFEKYDKSSLKMLLIGKTVVANYGVKHIYDILDIDFTKTPMSLTTYNGKECTYVDYFKQKYAVNITNFKQPMLVAQKKKKNTQEKILLVPQIVSLFNSICPNEFNKKLQEKLERKKWKLPDEKDAFAVKMIKQLGESEVIKKSAHNFDGITLNPPLINIDHRVIVPEQGVFTFRGRILRPVELTNWGIVYVQGKDKQADNADVSRLVYHLKAVSQQYGIKILNDPGTIQVTGSMTDWKKTISQDIEKYGAPQFLIFLLRDQETVNYPHIKQLMVNYKFPSQVIKRRTINQSKKQFALTAEILLQIQSKIGATIWQLGSNVDLTKRKLMHGGLYLHHQNSKVSLSFVGYVNSQCTQIYSYCKKDLKDYNEINFETLALYWAKNYVINNKFPPDTIIIYREENQTNMQDGYISKELQQIRSAMRKVGEKTRIPNYNPSIAYITVERKHKVEVYSRSEDQNKDFMIENPEAGTVVLERHEDGSNFDFYLNSNRSLEQSNRPVKFTALESPNFNADNLVTFTYQQCYNYPNYMGALDVPACLQYAHKLSQFSAATNVQIGYEDKMSRVPYFI